MPEQSLTREAEEWTWCPSGLPDRGVVVETKIDGDGGGERNRQNLKRGPGRLWFLPDDSMYVYYEPTHWRTIREEQR